MLPLKTAHSGAIESDPAKIMPTSSISKPPPSSMTEKLLATEQTLTDVQKEILADLVEYQHYPKLLVLKAFKECNETANMYDIQIWCGKNEGLVFDDDSEEGVEVDDTAESSSSGSDLSDEEEDDLNAPPQRQQSPKGMPMYTLQCSPIRESIDYLNWVVSQH